MSWSSFAVVFLAFFVTHSVPVRPAIKLRLVTRFGSRGFVIGYSVLSLLMLVLLIRSAAQAPYIELWPQFPWQRHIVHLGMLIVCLILAFSLARPNPFSFGGAQNDTFDPNNPGIVRLTRHPVLMALALWAGLHLLPNGDVAHVLLFGALGGFAIAGRALVNRRKKRELGEDVWQSLNAAVNAGPLIRKPSDWRNMLVRLSLGVAAFASLILLHPVITGVTAL